MGVSKEAAPNRWAGRMATGWAEQRNPAPTRCRLLVPARSPLGQWKAGREGPGGEKEQKEEPSQGWGGVGAGEELSVHARVARAAP